MRPSGENQEVDWMRYHGKGYCRNYRNRRHMGRSDKQTKIWLHWNHEFIDDIGEASCGASASGSTLMTVTKAKDRRSARFCYFSSQCSSCWWCSSPHKQNLKEWLQQHSEMLIWPMAGKANITRCKTQSQSYRIQHSQKIFLHSSFQCNITHSTNAFSDLAVL